MDASFLCLGKYGNLLYRLIEVPPKALFEINAVPSFGVLSIRLIEIIPHGDVYM